MISFHVNTHRCLWRRVCTSGWRKNGVAPKHGQQSPSRGTSAASSAGETSVSLNRRLSSFSPTSGATRLGMCSDFIFDKPWEHDKTEENWMWFWMWSSGTLFLLQEVLQEIKTVLHSVLGSYDDHQRHHQETSLEGESFYLSPYL